MRIDLEHLGGLNAPAVVLTAVQVAIEDAAGPINMIEIKQITGLPNGKIARCLNRLVGKGLVRRWRERRTVTLTHPVSGRIYDQDRPIWTYQSTGA